MKNLMFYLFFFCITQYSCIKEQVPIVTTAGITSVTGTSAVCGGTITNEGSGTVLSRGLCWGTGTTPTISDSKTIDGAGAGSFVSNLSGLNGATTYYVRAYATNKAGTGYGMTMSFKTLGAKAEVSGLVVTNLTGVSAKVAGAINPNYLPTTVEIEYGIFPICDQSIAVSQNPLNGEGLITVSANISGLLPQNTYYVRLKAINQLGTTYSEGRSFRYSVSDKDGNSYSAVLIGTQIWLTENLKTTRFRDDVSIPMISINSTWVSRTSAAYCWYGNDISNRDLYGGLYNWYAVNTSKLCPSGWHVPSESEFTTLFNFLGGSLVAGGKLKEAGITHWITPNASATNESGFNALPGGYRNIYNDAGAFVSKGYEGCWWTSSENEQGLAWYHGTNYESGRALTNAWGKTAGFSVRCIKD